MHRPGFKHMQWQAGGQAGGRAVEVGGCERSSQCQGQMSGSGARHTLSTSCVTTSDLTFQWLLAKFF